MGARAPRGCYGPGAFGRPLAEQAHEADYAPQTSQKGIDRYTG
jgi:hypothetical protein